MAQATHMKYHLIEFLESTHVNIKYAVVPDTWVKKELTNCRVNVAYPTEDLETTKVLAKYNNIDTAFTNWKQYLARVKCTSMSYDDLASRVRETNFRKDAYNPYPGTSKDNQNYTDWWISTISDSKTGSLKKNSWNDNITKPEVELISRTGHKRPQPLHDVQIHGKRPRTDDTSNTGVRLKPTTSGLHTSPNPKQVINETFTMFNNNLSESLEVTTTKTSTSESQSHRYTDVHKQYRIDNNTGVSVKQISVNTSTSCNAANLNLTPKVNSGSDLREGLLEAMTRVRNEKSSYNKLSKSQKFADDRKDQFHDQWSTLTIDGRNTNAKPLKQPRQSASTLSAPNFPSHSSKNTRHQLQLNDGYSQQDYCTAAAKLDEGNIINHQRAHLLHTMIMNTQFGAENPSILPRHVFGSLEQNQANQFATTNYEDNYSRVNKRKSKCQKVGFMVNMNSPDQHSSKQKNLPIIVNNIEREIAVSQTKNQIINGPIRPEFVNKNSSSACMKNNDTLVVNKSSTIAKDIQYSEPSAHIRIHTLDNQNLPVTENSEEDVLIIDEQVAFENDKDDVPSTKLNEITQSCLSIQNINESNDQPISKPPISTCSSNPQSCNPLIISQLQKEILCENNTESVSTTTPNLTSADVQPKGIDRSQEIFELLNKLNSLLTEQGLNESKKIPVPVKEYSQSSCTERNIDPSNIITNNSNENNTIISSCMPSEILTLKPVPTLDNLDQQEMSIVGLNQTGKISNGTDNNTGNVSSGITKNLLNIMKEIPSLSITVTTSELDQNLHKIPDKITDPKEIKLNKPTDIKINNEIMTGQNTPITDKKSDNYEINPKIDYLEQLGAVTLELNAGIKNTNIKLNDLMKNFQSYMQSYTKLTKVMNKILLSVNKDESPLSKSTTTVPNKTKLNRKKATKQDNNRCKSCKAYIKKASKSSINRSRRPFELPPLYDPNDSRWTVKYREPGPDLVELVPFSRVYVQTKELEECKRLSNGSKMMARRLLKAVFKEEALEVCSITGSRAGRFNVIRPGLDENARIVMLNYVDAYEKEQGWRSYDRQSILSSIRCQLKEIRARKEEKQQF